MQRIVPDYRAYDTLIQELKTQGFKKIKKSQENFFFPGIFFIYKNDTEVYLEQLQKDKIPLLQRLYDDLWK